MSFIARVSVPLSAMLCTTDELVDVTVAAVRLELAEEDATEIREGRATTLHQSYSSSTLLVVGMEIEDQQYVPDHTNGDLNMTN